MFGVLFIMCLNWKYLLVIIFIIKQYKVIEFLLYKIGNIDHFSLPEFVYIISKIMKVWLKKPMLPTRFYKILANDVTTMIKMAAWCLQILYSTLLK